MKLLIAVGGLLGAMIAAIAIILNAPPWAETETRAIVGVGFAVAFAVIMRGPIGKAIAQQLGGQPAGLPPGALTEVLDEVQGLRQEIAELHERVDFTERILSQREPDKLPPKAR